MDYYKILGLSHSADSNAIKHAFRVKAKEYHPDVNGHPDAAELFRNVHDAYEVLGNETRRAEYDRALHRPLTVRRPSVRQQQTPPPGHYTWARRDTMYEQTRWRTRSTAWAWMRTAAQITAVVFALRWLSEATAKKIAPVELTELLSSIFDIDPQPKAAPARASVERVMAMAPAQLKQTVPGTHVNPRTPPVVNYQDYARSYNEYQQLQAVAQQAQWAEQARILQHSQQIQSMQQQSAQYVQPVQHIQNLRMQQAQQVQPMQHIQNIR